MRERFISPGQGNPFTPEEGIITKGHVSSPGRSRTVVNFVLTVFLAIVFSAGSASALMTERNLSGLASGSDAIVIGTVETVISGWNPDQTHIVTTVQFAVNESLKGNVTGTIPLSFYGGTVGDTTEWSEDSPVLSLGELAGIFLTNDTDAPWKLKGLTRGVYPLIPDSEAGAVGKKSRMGLSAAEFREMVAAALMGEEFTVGEEVPAALAARGMVREASAQATPVIAGVSPISASGGTDSVITITGTGFGTKAYDCSYADVGFFYREQLGYPYLVYASGYPDCTVNPNDIVSWSDTRIQVKVPSNIFSGPFNRAPSSGYLVVFTDDEKVSNEYPFAVTFGYGKEKWNSNAIFLVNAAGYPGLTSVTQNAANTWNSQIPSSSFHFVYGGTSTSHAIAHDGKSLIYFGPEDDFDDPTTIGSASHWSENGKIVEADIELNSGVSWTTGVAGGTTFSIERVILHEFGHWLRLTDLYGNLDGYPLDYTPEKKVMFGISDDSYGNMNLKTLSASDIAGIRWIYPVPVVSGISPNTGRHGGTYHCTITGSNFRSGAVAKLTRTGSANLTFSGVTVVSSTQITGDLTIPVSASAGTWTVTVVQDGGTGNGPASFTILEDAPVTNFTATPRSGVPPLTVNFTDLSTGNPTSWAWNFGDGTNSTERNPIHVYTIPAEYNVSLTAGKGGSSMTLTKVNYISVRPLISLPGQTKLPTDPDGDGIHEDLNGNGRLDFNDLILMFLNLSWINGHEPVALFDLNGNGRMDFNDVILLFQEINRV
jgi:PKD repeat protein